MVVMVAVVEYLNHYYYGAMRRKPSQTLVANKVLMDSPGKLLIDALLVAINTGK